MGRPLPGYVVALVDPVTGEVGDEGEICLDLDPRPAALMTGYRDEHGQLPTRLDGRLLPHRRRGPPQR